MSPNSRGDHWIPSVWTIEARRKSEGVAADYDRAVAATGYGLFNVLLLLATLPIAWTCIIDTTSTTFILNTVECVFELTMLRRGLAVSAIYMGMLIAGPLWDFLLQDRILGCLGKRNVMAIGMFFDAICNVCWAHATSFYVFVLLKFVSGMLIAGPLSVVMAYLTEFHAPAHQDKFDKWTVLPVMVGNIIPAGLAATLMLRTPWFNFSIYDHFYPTWRVYLLICAIPSVLGFIVASLMPESPKFLMSQGKNRAALRLLRTMYCMNNFKFSSQYPITELTLTEKPKSQRSACKDTLEESVSKMKMLLSSPHAKTVLIVLFLQFTAMIAFNVMRLWIPPLFVMMNNFRVLVRKFYPPGEYITMCEMIFPRIQAINHASCNYTLPNVESAVYVNSTTIASSVVGFSFLLALLTQRRIAKIVLTSIMFLLSAVGCFGANWAVEIPNMLVLVAFVIVASRIGGNAVAAYSAQVIPESLRPTASNMTKFVSNLGAAGGNIIFALILDIDCLSAFLWVGTICLICVMVPFFLIDQPDKQMKKDIERY